MINSVWILLETYDNRKKTTNSAQVMKTKNKMISPDSSIKITKLYNKVQFIC